MTKRQLFATIVFETQKEFDNYDLVEHQLMKCYDIMVREVKGFQNLSLTKQWYIVHTACLISVGSSMRQLRGFRIFGPKKEPSNIEKNFSIEIDFEEKERLELKEQKKLNNSH